MAPMLLALLAFAGMAVFMIRDFVYDGGDDYAYYYYRHRDLNFHDYQYSMLFHQYHLSDLGPILLFIAIGLGIALGGIHFWKPLQTRTWSFLIHRSTSRISILGSKIMVALLGLIVCLGLPWMWAYAQFNHVKVTGFPTPIQILWEGWLLIGLGFISYLGVGLCALSRAKWYGVRFFGLAFAFLVLCCVFMQSSFGASTGVLLAGIAVLGIQLANQFLQREF